MNKKAILKLDIKVRQWELSLSILQEQLGYLRDKYPTQHTEAFLHALNVNADKITALKSQIDNLEKLENAKVQQEDY